MKSVVLPGGEKRVIHLLPGRMRESLEKGTRLPCVAVRDERSNYDRVLLVKRAACLGPSELEDRFDSPLPGTSGRGVMPLATLGPVLVWFEGDEPEVLTAEMLERL